MSKVIFIGSDRNILKENSPARARMIKYGKLFDELHIIIFEKSGRRSFWQQLDQNTWAYSTNSLTRWFYPFSASRIARRIISKSSKQESQKWIISGQDPFEAGLAAYWAARKTGAKLHLQVHTDFLSPFFKRQSILNRIRVLIARRLLPKAEGIRVASERIGSSLLQSKYYSLKTSPVVLPIFVPWRGEGFPYEYKRKHPDWSFVALTVCRFEKEKNLPLAFKVIKEIKKIYPFVGYLVVGDGKEASGLKSLAKRLGIENNVEFVSWQDDLSPYYLASDVYLQTSNYEGFGMAAVDAAIRGVGVITTDVGVAGQIFIDNISAEVCPVGDKKCLTGALLTYISDNSIREKLRSNARLLLKNSFVFSEEEYMQKFKSAIESSQQV